MRSDPIDTLMTRTVNRNLVKHAAGAAMFCPGCQAILDASRTVVYDSPVAMLVRCATCWDMTLAKMNFTPDDLARIMADRILDGRVLFARTRPSKKGSK